MNNYTVSCFIIVNDFNIEPILSKISDSFIIKSISIKGEMGIARPYDYSTFILLPNKANDKNFIEILVDFLNNLVILKNSISSREVEIVIHIDIAYDGQCNFELNPLQIELLNILKCSFSISCY